MLDRFSLRLARPFLDTLADRLKSRGVTADQISMCGFLAGITAAVCIGCQFFTVGLVLILLNRLCDGLDGAVARKTATTDSGAYLDICLDFVFYAAIVLGFAFADPVGNGLAAAALIFSFVATGSSFLAYAIMAERRQLASLRLPDKGFYYLGGLAEGTETIIFFCLFCLLPTCFPMLAWIFALLCLISAFLRILYGYTTLKKQHRK